MKYIDADTMTTQAKYNERKPGLEWVVDYRIYPQGRSAGVGKEGDGRMVV